MRRSASSRPIAGARACSGSTRATAPGAHLIDALRDQAVADEVLRLVTPATPNGVVSGEVICRRNGARLGIDVTKGAGHAPLTIRFRRL